MTSHTFQSYKTRFLQIVFGLAVVAVGLYTVRHSMGGSDRTLKMVVVASGVIAAMLALKDKYWLLSVVLFGFDTHLAIIRFTGAELGSITLLSVFFVRRALHLNRSIRPRPGLIWAAVPFLVWMAVIWFMNPTGLLMFGSSSIGGRFYFKVYLAFLSMAVFSAMCFNEKESRLLIVAFVFGVAARVLRGLVVRDVAQMMDVDSSHYVFSHLCEIATFFLCRYPLTEIMTRFWPFFGFFSTFFFTVYSGNRHSTAMPIFSGLVLPFLIRRDRLRSVVLMVVAAIVVLVAVAGHGSLWNLPYSVQRSLSFLPGKWSRRVENLGFQDSFRDELRRRAMDQISTSPWFGSGGFSMDLEAMSWAGSDSFGDHVLARNWHSLWLGMAADFGIPLSVAWAVFTFVLLVSGFRWVGFSPPGSWSQIASSYFYVVLLETWVDSFFSGGHSAYTPERFFSWLAC